MTPTAPPPPYFQSVVLPSLVPAHIQCKIMIHPSRSRNFYSPFEAWLLPQTLLTLITTSSAQRWARCHVHVAQLVLWVFLLPLRLCFHVIRHCLSHLKTTNANLMLGKVQLLCTVLKLLVAQRVKNQAGLIGQNMEQDGSGRFLDMLCFHFHMQSACFQA